MSRMMDPLRLSRLDGTRGDPSGDDPAPAPLLTPALVRQDGRFGREAPMSGPMSAPASAAIASVSPRSAAHAGAGGGSGLTEATTPPPTHPDAWTAARRVAPLAVDVLLQGETGAGKDALAREIHRWSGRHGKFIAINCAAIPEHLAESELFGHEAGAFTGAVKAREGKLEAADKGTLYLDEIDSMPLDSQAKLLRALQERGAERLGGSRFYRADFRVIASTKVPLPTLVKQGRFRQDLYFRLNVVKLQLTPLRDSPDRVQALFEAFAREASERHGLPVPPMVPATRQHLLTHSWPGNVRELRNAAERHVLGFELVDEEMAAIMGASVPGSVGGAVLSPGAASGGGASVGAGSCGAPPGGPAMGTGLSPGLPPHEGDGTPPGAEEGAAAGSLRDRMRLFERELIVHTLKQHGGSVAKASTELQVPPNTLYYRIKTLGIQFTPE
ncbi:sigma-54 dependent transcriptional regulator [Roseateles sp. SL47]|uniref:sigma 54-interacting transcriptional regulator n=1 Tax=Roseateles sp. SL47 TaxID=2995138 RepID=UPI002271BE69|nr:sigma-54 dependent transcriptional regulator [Roseateles sp. SL47]WAC74566.1 sigma-54 dependent transcriptional regulator [Roseateles sp. SL47]